MKARGILYSAQMIKAKLASKKTMTRRMSGLKSINENPDKHRYIGDSNDLDIPRLAKKYDDAIYYAFEDNWSRWHVVTCPFGKVGDILYAKETWQHDIQPDYENNTWVPNGKYVYRADGTIISKEELGDLGVWKPSIYMPRNAARIIDQIVSIRVERLQDITVEDIIKEGIITTLREHEAVILLKHEWEKLWISINGEESWIANPWVWVIETKNISTTGWKEVDSTISSQLEKIINNND